MNRRQKKKTLNDTSCSMSFFNVLVDLFIYSGKYNVQTIKLITKLDLL